MFMIWQRKGPLWEWKMLKLNVWPRILAVGKKAIQNISLNPLSQSNIPGCTLSIFLYCCSAQPLNLASSSFLHPCCSVSWIPFLNAVPSYFLPTPSSFSATLLSTLPKAFFPLSHERMEKPFSDMDCPRRLSQFGLHVQAGQLASQDNVIYSSLLHHN